MLGLVCEGAGVVVFAFLQLTYVSFKYTVDYVRPAYWLVNSGYTCRRHGNAEREGG